MYASNKPRLISNMYLSSLFLFLLTNHLSLATAESAAKLPESSNADGLQTYIVHVDRSAAASLSASSSFDEIQAWYRTFLPASTASSGAKHRLVHAYKNIADGFAARFTEQEFTELKRMPGFLLAYPDRIVKLQTTHSPDFLGLRRDAPGLWSDASFGKGVIVGMVDTGISPDLASFNDDGMPAPPAKWKGVCEFKASSCNNKLIGARTFVKGMRAMLDVHSAVSAADEPYDDYGHGTHTASTAAGMFVKHANVDGQANGTASGMAPFAHLAVYKVCKLQGCALSDIVAGMDAGIEDGVDVLSLSIGGIFGLPFFGDPIAIASFRAMEKGIFVSCAGGNYGPTYGTVTNGAPWILTVGASTTDRSIQATVELGSKAQLTGESAYQPGLSSKLLPLVYPGILGASDALCDDVDMSGMDVKGKVVVCEGETEDLITMGENVKKAGGAAMIIVNDQDQGVTTQALPHVLPVSHVSYTDGASIKSYIQSDPAPTATIKFKGTRLGTSPAPVVASFSSRGPCQTDPYILKPDIIGPGVNILAAWPFAAGSNKATKFNIISGTSMATPHLSGIAALLKSAHPDWSPAAIKSAIMTTAYTNATDGHPIRDQSLNTADLFTVGSGHVYPTKASNPGLIYDIHPNDYIPYLCGLRYTDKQVGAIIGRLVRCSNVRVISSSELNYPSYMVTLGSSNRAVINRTVTNVGAPRSVYTVRVSSPAGVKVAVSPQRLVFSKLKEKAEFSVTFSGQISTDVAFGYLTWISSNRSITVNSPFVVTVQAG